MNEELRDEVAGVLGEHVLHPSINICTTAPGLERGPCDWRPIEGAGSIQAQHRAHAADALMPLLERREREAEARALREAARDWAGGEWRAVNFNRAGRDEHPGMRQARWLRDRADAITTEVTE